MAASQFGLVKDGGLAPDYVPSVPALIQFGRWQHVAAVYDPTSNPTVKLYVGGNPAGTGSWSMGPTSSQGPMLLGGKSDGSRTFDGVIDDVRVYDRALSQEEVQAIVAQ
jgi:hypothetical protein